MCIHAVFKERIPVLIGQFQVNKVTSTICDDLLQVFSTPVCNGSHTHVKDTVDKVALLVVRQSLLDMEMLECCRNIIFSMIMKIVATLLNQVNK